MGLIMRKFLRFLCICLKQVGDLEHLVQRAAITDPRPSDERLADQRPVARLADVRLF